MKCRFNFEDTIFDIEVCDTENYIIEQIGVSEYTYLAWGDFRVSIIATSKYGKCGALIGVHKHNHNYNNKDLNKYINERFESEYQNSIKSINQIKD